MNTEQIMEIGNIVSASDSRRLAEKAKFISKELIVGPTREIPVPPYALSAKMKSGEVKFFMNPEDPSAGLFNIPEGTTYLQFPDYRKHANGRKLHIHYGEPKFIHSKYPIIIY